MNLLTSSAPSLSPHSLCAVRGRAHKKYVSKGFLSIPRSCLKPLDMKYVSKGFLSIPRPCLKPLDMKYVSKGFLSIPRPCLKPVDREYTDRRTANYHPSVWDYRLIQSLNSPYTYDRFDSYLEKLKQEVKNTLRTATEPVHRLELISDIQRVGVGYHFEEEIREALDFAYSSNCYGSEDVYCTALCFRLLRQNHYHITSEVFRKFNSWDGKLMDTVSWDVKGLSSLYEASYLAVQGEDTLEEVGLSAMERLNALVINDQGMRFDHSLQSPLHWKALRLEARKYIDRYKLEDRMNPALLELAKLDFNLVQSIHQRDLIELSNWWRDMGFKDALSFSRDRLVENFIWAMGITYEPQFSKCRIGLAKFICILTAIDDMYDVYGSLDELELFTAAVSRWSIEAMQGLPDYMKICYKAMFDFANYLSLEIQRDQGIDVSPYIAKEWERLCQAYIVEARWFNRKYTPSLDEYIENAWISVGGPGAMVHAYILRGETITIASLDCLSNKSGLIYSASLITRLSDDLGTSEAEMMRGDVPKSIQCYMNETGVSEEEAREHIKSLMRLCWKNLNEECLKSSLPKCIASMALNMARTSQCIFEHGDGIGTSDGDTKNKATLLFVESFDIERTY